MIAEMKQDLIQALNTSSVEQNCLVYPDDDVDDQGEAVFHMVVSVPALGISEDKQSQLVETIKSAVEETGKFVYHASERHDFVVVRFRPL